MAYCVKCGAKVDDGIRFCPYCGAEIPLGQGQYDQQSQDQGWQGQYSQQGPYDQSGEGYFHPEDVRANKVMAVLSYIGILVLIPLLAGNKSSEYLRHHIIRTCNLDREHPGGHTVRRGLPGLCALLLLLAP